MAHEKPHSLQRLQFLITIPNLLFLSKMVFSYFFWDNGLFFKIPRGIRPTEFHKSGALTYKLKVAIYHSILHDIFQNPFERQESILHFMTSHPAQPPHNPDHPAHLIIRPTYHPVHLITRAILSSGHLNHQHILPAKHSRQPASRKT